MLEVDLLVEDLRWSAAGVDWEARVELACRAAIAATPFAGLLTSAGCFDVCVRLSNDAAVQLLNHETRGRDAPTNILSFQFIDQPDPAQLPGRPAATLGDLILAWETIAAEALTAAKNVDAHVSHLIVHGVLHLLGYDHLVDCEADAMETREVAALATLGIANPFPTSLPTSLDTC